MALLWLFTCNICCLIYVQDVNNPVLKEILLSGPISLTACALVYCIITPFLEETVYRGFLLKYLASTMEWPQALLISSAIFSASHLSGENFLQLFIIGIVLGCSYCWTGKLSSSIAIHSMYNALTLLMTFTSWTFIDNVVLGCSYFNLLWIITLMLEITVINYKKLQDLWFEYLGIARILNSIGLEFVQLNSCESILFKSTLNMTRKGVYGICASFVVISSNRSNF